MFFKKKIPPYPFKEYPIMQQPSLVPTFGQQAQIDRKFGMFLHFGINTFTEWSDGKLPIESYQPTAIDAENWVKTAYEAGMNYVIIITKHHDGFCLWNTHTTTYSVNYSPNKTDVVKAVADACQKYGVKLYPEDEPFLTDLFPVSLNRGKFNILFYRADHVIEEYIRLKERKAALLGAGAYFGGNRTQLATSYGRLLSYTDDAVRRLLAENGEKEQI